MNRPRRITKTDIMVKDYLKKVQKKIEGNERGVPENLRTYLEHKRLEKEYAPGGVGYEKAKENFYSMAVKQKSPSRKSPSKKSPSKKSPSKSPSRKSPSKSPSRKSPSKSPSRK